VTKGTHKFTPEYEYRDKDTNKTFVAPFPVAFFGIHEEILGVGIIVGNIDDNPVIDVQDVEDGKTYTVMGYESWWTPVTEGIVDVHALNEDKIAVDSVAAYKTRLDAEWKARQEAHKQFLDDNGLDPSL